MTMGSQGRIDFLFALSIAECLDLYSFGIELAEVIGNNEETTDTHEGNLESGELLIVMEMHLPQRNIWVYYIQLKGKAG